MASFPFPPTFSDRRSGSPPAAWATIVLLGATPVVFALATWDPSLADARLHGARWFGTPVLLVELLVITLAIAGGWTVQRALALLGPSQRAALAGLIGVAAFTTVFVAPDPATAAARSGADLIHLVFGFAVADLLGRWDAGTRRRLWPAIAGGVVAYIALLPLYMIAVGSWAGHDWTEFGLAIVHVRQLGFYALTGSAAAIGLAATSEDARRRRLWIAVAAVCMALSTWSGTRSSLLAVLGATLVAAAVVPKLRTRALLLATVAATIGGLALSLLLPLPNELFGLWRMSESLASEDVSSGRVRMWLGTVGGIAERPLLGHGEGQFQHWTVVSNGYNHPHNAILQVAYQWGLVGLACAVALCWPPLRAVLRRANDAPDAAAPALLVLLAVLAMSMVEGTLFHAYPITLAALSLAYLLTIPASAAPR